MKFIKFILVFCSIGILTACGSDDSTSQDSAQSKPVNSEWTSDEGALFDLSSLQIGQESQMAVALKAGGLCSCTAMIVGTNTKGQVSMYDCLLKADSPEGAPTCEDVEKSATYNIEDNVLTLCETSGEETCNTLR